MHLHLQARPHTLGGLTDIVSALAPAVLQAGTSIYTSKLNADSAKASARMMASAQAMQQQAAAAPASILANPMNQVLIAGGLAGLLAYVIATTKRRKGKR